ncbi:MAG: acetyltransferase [Gammaproteobacteria bacterium]|nr:acetyltransferase [Gammaproteobacteria bacterium]
MIFDVFNGDADGICALQQLRLADPLESALVTGIKRDIKLLEKITPEPGDSVTVLDVSMEKNKAALIQMLEKGISVTYFDHHMAGDIPEYPNLDVHIDTAPNVCTSLLVNGYLKGKFLAWAVTGAFGDNLYDSAIRAAKPLALSQIELDALRELGTCINYNGYGASIDDLFYAPDDLFRKVHPYENPLDFIAADPAFEVLKNGYADDLNQAGTLKPEIEEQSVAMFVMPDEKWARRISGVFANQLAREHPARAHALLTEKPDGSFLVSVRSPLENKAGADKLCSQFPTGGGRQAAAGINQLESASLESFVNAFRATYSAA